MLVLHSVGGSPFRAENSEIYRGVVRRFEGNVSAAVEEMPHHTPIGAHGYAVAIW